MSIQEVLNRYVECPALRVPAVGTMRRQVFASSVRGVNEQARTISFVASNESVDRYGDVIRSSGWNTTNYLRNPIVLWAHKSSDPPIGRTVKLNIEHKSMMQTVEFADKETYPFADTIFNLYKNGFLRSVSVGFRPLEQPTPITDETGRATGYEFTKQELLELSCVPLPANPDALARAIDAGVITRTDAGKFFVSDDPAQALQKAKLQISLQKLELSLLDLRVDLLLKSLKPADDVTNLEELFATVAPNSKDSITSLDQLDRALRGA